MVRLFAQMVRLMYFLIITSALVLFWAFRLKLEMDQDPSLTIIHFTFSSALLHSNIVPFIMREIEVLIFIIYWGINELSENMINRLLLCSAGSKEEMIEFSNFLNFKFWYLKFFKEFWVTLSFWILCIHETTDTYKHKQTKEIVVTIVFKYNSPNTV